MKKKISYRAVPIERLTSALLAATLAPVNIASRTASKRDAWVVITHAIGSSRPLLAWSQAAFSLTDADAETVAPARPSAATPPVGTADSA